MSWAPPPKESIGAAERTGESRELRIAIRDAAELRW